MLQKLHASLMTFVLMVWSSLVVAQTAPGGTTAPGTTSPTGTTTGGDPAAAAGEGMDWIWIAIAVIVIAALLYYFLGRRRSGTRI